MSSSFIEALLEDVRIGYGFVPLVGSGLSAPSGIPIGNDFGNYIFYYLHSIYRGERSWDPEDPIWPRLEEVDVSQNALQQKRQAAREWLGCWEQEQHSGAALEAIGSLADWRAALAFLSRLPACKAGDSLLNVELTAPSDAVVDSAFIHVTRNRQLTLAHMMLAHCADALRIQTILTTNFDTLIEDAFRRQGVHLTTFDVHQRAGLPTAQLVLAQRSIVKLHGGRYGLRADYSLDEEPSAVDQATFAQYFAARESGSQRRVDAKRRRGESSRKHLLVMGVSGYDSRTMRLIRHAVDTQPKLKVYWVFFRRPQPDRVARIVDRLQVPKERFVCTVQADLGLLLLNLYQSHYLSLPPSGADYPSHLLYPPEIYPQTRYKQGVRESQVNQLKQRILAARSRAASESNDNSDSKPLSRLVYVCGGGGLSSVASGVYDELRSQYTTIWLELDQHADTIDFLIALVDAVVQKLGSAMVTPPLSRVDATSCLECLHALVGGAHRPFLVFVNGRDGPGSGAHWKGKHWTARQQSEFWRRTTQLDSLPRDSLYLVVLVENNGLEEPAPDIRRSWERMECESCLRLDAEQVFSQLTVRPPEDWSWQKQRFVFALTLFRKSRYLAALTTWGLIKATKRLSNDEDNDEYRATKCREYIDVLFECGAIRRQPGGMVWMHGDIRQRLYNALRGVDRIRREEAFCHQGIADWYVKLFRSSNDPHAALESIYHRIRCAECASRSEPNGDVEDVDVQDLEMTSILEAVETLELARDRILVSARSTSSTFILQQVLDRIENSKSRNGVFARHAPLWQDLAVVCEDLLCDFARTRGDKFTPRTRRTRAPQSVPGKRVRNLISRRQDADGLLHTRKYDESEVEYEMLFRKLGIRLSFAEADEDNSRLVQNMRRLAKQWCLRGRSEAEMQLAVRGLRGYMFLQMLISQASAWKTCRTKQDAANAARSSGPDMRLRYAESIYTLATSVTRYIKDHDFLQVENTYLRTHYGVLLAELNRFKEAHRRLNEATGYLSKSTKATDGLAWAIIDLRRAETYLFQSRQEQEYASLSAHPCDSRFPLDDGNQADWQRSAAAHLDDMRYALERAKSRFVNHRKDVWWWTLLLELELSFFQERCTQQSRLDPEFPPLSPRELEECAEIVKNGLLIVHSDGVRLARMLDLLMCIGREFPESETQAHALLNRSQEDLIARLPRVRNDLQPDLAEFVRSVRRDYRQRKSRRADSCE